MKTIKNFVKENKIKINVEYADNNPNMNDPKWQVNHYKITLKMSKKQLTTYFSQGTGIKENPTAEGVLDCLASDSAGIENVRNFGDWANEYGYDTDSRKAEKTYNTCVKQAEKLKNFLGNDLYEELLYNVEKL